MYKAGLVGLGFMGAAHLNNYVLLKQNGLPVELTAVCDVDANKLKSGGAVEGNLKIGGETIDLSPYKLYTGMEEMLRAEDLDFVDLCLPTYLHAPMAVKAMEAGVNVFCEKPMAISGRACDDMIACAKRTGKRLMIGQTLRYWNVYEYLKQCVDNKTYGECISANFFRGGSTPVWSWENWLLQKEKSGGCLLDQHIHDVDAINWLFGMPESLSAAGRVVYDGSGYDSVSTNYYYPDKVVGAQDDWTINGGGFGFEMRYRVNFAKAALIYENGTLTVYPVDGEKFIPELPDESGYYKELRLFLELLGNPGAFDYLGLLESHADTIRIAEAEIQSADLRGKAVPVKGGAPIEKGH